MRGGVLMKYCEYEEVVEFENLEELKEYCVAYADAVPEEFLVEIDGKTYEFNRAIKGQYGVSELNLNIYESCNYMKDECRYIVIEYSNSIIDRLSKFVYINEKGKKNKEFFIGEVDSSKIDDMFEIMEKYGLVK